MFLNKRILAQILKGIAPLIPVLILALNPGCNSIPGITDTEATVWLKIDIPESMVCLVDENDWCETDVTIQLNTKDPDPDDVSEYQQVILKYYQATFYRTDGGQIPIYLGAAGPLNALMPMPPSEITLRLGIVSPDAKNRPPLEYLRSNSYGYDPETGNSYISGYIIIEFWGEEMSGKNVKGEGSFSAIFY